jgi:AmmeMemoRadiSam system protein B
VKTIRRPAVAGTFYDDDRESLAADVDQHVAVADLPDDLEPPVAVIAPHAGYRYSGPTAGFAYAAAKRAGGARRVVVAGPAHRVAVDGVGTSSATAWDTPLGPVPIDRPVCDRLVAEGLAVVADRAHAPEHSIEVQLPFLQRTIGSFELVPLVVGNAGPAQVADALEVALEGGGLLVISSDLSHYHDDATAKARDGRTARAILDGRECDIGPLDACGAAPIGGLLELARRRGLHGRLLDLRTSGDTAGDRDRVVGYGAFAFA